MQEFRDVITTRDQLRGVIGEPIERVKKKVLPELDLHCRNFIAHSPFVVISTSDGQGNADVSPKGDPAGFVRILDDNTLVIPDRPGNRRVDGFENILQNPHVGLLFLIPGRNETVRVNGKAMIVQDEVLLRSFSIKGRPPKLALVVKVEEAFFHCSRCMIRSGLWAPDRWPAQDGLASMARVMFDIGKGIDKIEDIEALIHESETDKLN
ncbi:MAG: pyridoxamine 5'-phosphate oxidase family protein [Hyphomicrobiales bacterium]|nr:pyridoxamine 5'-phosphate oxidase family protein [Hyphomicrobiales bacterium]MCP4999925.1 pyridoxamine 5'-phosphate oxidase family protein [Hyphomicrobiales bacterium]